MKYISTYGGVNNLTFTDAVMMGLATDGGLILPDKIPSLDADKLLSLSKLSYTELAYEIISLFATDYDKKALKSIIHKSYTGTFDTDKIIPIVSSKTVKIAELFHGPTFAFKDLALQFLGNLFEDILKRENSRLNIIGATSGDTGSAAIYGIRGKKGINIFILYPDAKVSDIQEAQMTSVLDNNVYTIAIKGDFDDCQNIVKRLFNDIDFKSRYNLGAVNSINFARILAQVVYYFYIYFHATKSPNDKLNFVVPTGNFGNIFACFIAKKMGLNIGKIILATNSNDILSRAINDGDYSIKNIRAEQTFSPSMDIQVASNFERYLYYLYDENADIVKKIMSDFKSTHRIDLRDKLSIIQDTFLASKCGNEECIDIIKTFYETNNYILDPHTACGVMVADKLGFNGDDTICLATAHPAKFSSAIGKALGIEPVKPEAFKQLATAKKKTCSMINSYEAVKEFIITNLSK